MDEENKSGEFEDGLEDDVDDGELTEEEEAFVSETEDYFPDVWKQVKEDSKELSKKDLAKKMFVLGAMLCKKNMDDHFQEMINTAKNNPEKFKKMLQEQSAEDEFWEEGAFVEGVGPESDAKMRTFHMKHDEEMNYKCQECSAIMSAHNRDWHNGRCDHCFDKEVHQQ